MPEEELALIQTNDPSNQNTRQQMKWAQKARQLWLTNGDKNTSYFHMIVTNKRMRRRILWQLARRSRVFAQYGSEIFSESLSVSTNICPTL